MEGSFSLGQGAVLANLIVPSLASVSTLSHDGVVFSRLKLVSNVILKNCVKKLPSFIFPAARWPLSAAVANMDIGLRKSDLQLSILQSIPDDFTFPIRVPKDLEESTSSLQQSLRQKVKQ